RAEGLGEVVVGAETERAHQDLLLPAHGQHHDRHARARTDRFAHLEPGEPRHVDVEHHEVRGFLGEQPHGAGTIARLDHEVSRLAEREGDELAQLGIVVRDQHLHAASSAGRVRLKRVRPAAVRSKTTRPPWRSMIDFTSQSPSPRPTGSGSVPPRRKRAKSCASSTATGPAPSSSTHACTCPACASAPMRTTLSSGANLLALASRLTNTCVRRVLSPLTDGNSSGRLTSSVCRRCARSEPTSARASSTTSARATLCWRMASWPDSMRTLSSRLSM